MRMKNKGCDCQPWLVNKNSVAPPAGSGISLQICIDKKEPQPHGLYG